MMIRSLESRVSRLERLLTESVSLPNGKEVNTIGELICSYANKNASKLVDIVDDIDKFVARNSNVNRLSHGQFTLALSDVWDTKLSEDMIDLTDGTDMRIKLDSLTIFVDWSRKPN